jgi:hypothetical protein
MALVSQITCEGCGVTTHVSHSPAEGRPKTCHACRGKEAASVRDQHLAELASLPIEERLRSVEAWIYDYRPQWVPPPRF